MELEIIESQTSFPGSRCLPQNRVPRAACQKGSMILEMSSLALPSVFVYHIARPQQMGTELQQNQLSPERQAESSLSLSFVHSFGAETDYHSVVEIQVLAFFRNI